MRGEISIAQVVVELNHRNLLPAILFRTSRNQCDVDVRQAAINRKLRLEPAQQSEIKAAVFEIVRRYDVEHELVTTHPHYASLVVSGIAAHHAGQLLMWRLLLEELMAAGLLRVLVATGTVAAGVDFPARSVVITADSKSGGSGFRTLTASEFQQMSGRAGRRGKDTVGFCIAAPAPYCDARVLLRIAKQPPEPLVSSYFPAPSTVLNLLRYRNVDDLRFTVQRSLRAFVDRQDAKLLRLESEQVRQEVGERKSATQEVVIEDTNKQKPNRDLKKLNKKANRLEKRAAELEQKQVVYLEQTLEGLRSLGYLELTNLSTKGYWAANLCTSVVLELSEIIESGMLDGISQERLVAIVASISGDEHRNYLSMSNSMLEKADVKKIDEIVKRVQETEMPGVVQSLRVLTAAADTVVSWMHGGSWIEFRALLVLSGVAEGDAARLITQTAEHLNQLSRLYQTHKELALLAEQARHRLLRPPLTDVISVENL